MDGDQVVLMAELDGGARVAIAAEPVGSYEVGAMEVMAKLQEITSPIQKIASGVLAAVRQAGPSKATVELGFDLAIEAGQVVALFGKGRGEASIKVVLEWSPDGHGAVGRAPSLAHSS